MAGREVIGAKVRAPQVRALTRDRLHNAVSRIWEHRLGLIVAPAGSGKTTALAQFVDSVDVPAAWYRAEAADATEEAFVAHIDRACAGRFEGLRGGWKTVGDMIAAAEEWPGGRALIVIDEIDALWGTEAEAAVERLLDYLPPGWAILASARRRPGLNLSRLRVTGGLLEFGPEDLRFRFWEVERLFRDFYGEPLPPDQLAELTRRTEGWAAGLQLFHLATRGQSAPDRTRVLAELGRRSRLMREYLAANVIDQLPADLRAFLIDTSVLGRLTAELCNAVTGRTDSAQILTELEEARIFTQRTNDDAFRYHEVLRSHLEASLIDQVGDAGVRRRFLIAGELLEAAGAVPDALRAYCRSEEWDAVTRLLGGRGEEALDAGSDWIELLPAALMEQDPWLLLGSARRYVSLGRWEVAVDAYGQAELLFGHGQSAELCRRERGVVQVWLNPVGPLPGNEWPTLVRAATRRDPEAVLPALLREDTAESALAASIVLLLAGDARRATSLLGRLLERSELSLPVSIGAELVHAVAAMLGGAAVVIELDRIGERAEAAGLPWLAKLARDTVRSPSTLRFQDKGDVWGNALGGLLSALRTLLAGGGLGVGLDEAADTFRHAGAPALEAWARAASALAAARAGDPQAVVLAREAEVRARSAGVQGALAVALSALAATDRMDDGAYLADARRIGDATGIDISRLVGARRPGQASLGRQRLVGRDREQAELRAYVDAIALGRGRTVLISGPSGIGKTRLAEDLVDYATRSGVGVLWGQASSGAGPYWVWGQIIRVHLMERDLVADPVRADNLHALGRLVPELPELLPDVPLAAHTEANQHEVFQAAAGFFGSLCSRQPLLVVVDDLHLADATSIHLFEFLARSLSSQPIVLVGTHQDVDAARLHGLTAASRIRLGGLATQAIGDLVNDATGEVAASTLVAAMAELTEGNPYFVLEMARMLAADRPGQLKDLGRADLRLPASLRDLAIGRVAVLSEECRELLALASVIGRTFTLSTLATASGRHSEAVIECIEAAMAAGLVEEDGPAPATFRFTHGLLQEALYEAQSPADRALHHNRVGDAIELISTPVLEPRIPELAHHLLAGASRGDRARAAAYGRRAAAQALDHSAYEDALTWANTSLAVLSDLRGHTELRRRLLDLGAQAEAGLGGDDRAAGLRAAAALLLDGPDDVAEAQADDRASIMVRCLGPFEVSFGGATLDLSATKPRVRSLLRLLALRAGEPVHRELLIEALWPGDTDPRAGTRNLQTAVSALRHIAEPGVARGESSLVVRDGDSYRLVLGPNETTDVLELDRLGSRPARIDDDDLALVRATGERAARLYRGHLLEEEGASEWVVLERDRLRLLAADLIGAGARAALAMGTAADAQRLAERGLAIDRYGDRLWRVLIDALVALGDPAAAARATMQYEAVLAELGVKPG